MKNIMSVNVPKMTFIKDNENYGQNCGSIKIKFSKSRSLNKFIEYVKQYIIKRINTFET